MANTDSFIDEVTEEVRRDRLFRYFRRYGWIAVVVILGIVGWSAWTEWQRAQATAAARAMGDALLAALDAADPAARATALASVEARTPAAQALARLLAAQATLAAGTPQARAAAAAGFRAVAEDTRLGPEWRDLAALHALAAAEPPLTAEARRAALEPLAAPGRPYRVLAQEQIALALIEAGDPGGARAILQALAGDGEAPPGLQRRVMQMMVVLPPPDAGSGG